MLILGRDRRGWEDTFSGFSRQSHPIGLLRSDGPDAMTIPNSGPEANWLIYGANGYTGAMIAEEAAKRGHRPRLAGRNREALLALAERLRLEAVPCDLADGPGLQAAVSGCLLVLHCAGPFSETSRPMLDACLAEGAHYLDITGEIDVFSACHRRSAEASERGICVVPGVGFDVVPTDSVAALLKEALPDADSMVLAFEASGGPSVGTARTSVAGLARGGRVRRGERWSKSPWPSRPAPSSEATNRGSR